MMIIDNKKLRDEIDRALDDLELEEKNALIKPAFAAYMAGNSAGQDILGLKIDWYLTAKAAYAYVRNEYLKDLMRGGSVVQIIDKDGNPAGQKFVPWLKDYNEAGREQVHRIIEEGLKAGGSTGDMERVRSSRGTIAENLRIYFNQRRSHAETVARTEIMRIQNRGARDRYKAAGIKRVMMSKSAKPCEICAPYEGQVFNLNNLPFMLPLHPNCTHTWIPLPEDLPYPLQKAAV